MKDLRHHVEQRETKCKSIYSVNAFMWMFKNAKLIYDNTNHNKVCIWMVEMTRKRAGGKFLGSKFLYLVCNVGLSKFSLEAL